MQTGRLEFNPPCEARMFHGTGDGGAQVDVPLHPRSETDVGILRQP